MRDWRPGLANRSRLAPRITWRYSPPAIMAASFLVLIGIGTVLLWLPFSSHDGLKLGEAFFTACSAVTVTGLAVVDTGSALTGFGQTVVLILIHLGGLGLMTFAALTVMALGGKLGLSGQRLVREALDQTSPSDVLLLVRHIVVMSLLLELLGAVILATVWVPEMGWGQGLWFSVFHSVSAFNNAGFGLHGDSLMPWAGNPVINGVITALFIIGGLGFIVLLDLWRQRGFTRLNLHSKLTLVGSLALCLLGWALILLFEWNNAGTLAALPVSERPLAAWFTAVTPRTAGFNTVDTAQLSDPSTLVTMFLMFIGGGSNSTASGIKVGTFVVIMLSTWAFLRGYRQPQVFGRAIPMASVFRAYAVIVLSLMVVIISGFLVIILEPKLAMMDVLFEVFSAYGTVGLSRGITAQLSLPAQIVIVFLMFVGRIGPLALAFSLARKVETPHFHYPEGQVQIG